ncbi:MAG TPA: hypothetical protein VFJ16_16205 [Longimicrobium sp.]|nr:hypothetical protein [Longimicrobium sp.]
MFLSIDQLQVTSFTTTSSVAPSAAYSDEACDSPLCGPSEMRTGCTDTTAAR